MIIYQKHIFLLSVLSIYQMLQFEIVYACIFYGYFGILKCRYALSVNKALCCKKQAVFVNEYDRRVELMKTQSAAKHKRKK